MNKEPLPDPAMPKLLSISTVFEKNLEEYDAVVKERLLRFK
jgi:hypothetical protein